MTYLVDSWQDWCKPPQRFLEFFLSKWLLLTPRTLHHLKAKVKHDYFFSQRGQLSAQALSHMLSFREVRGSLFVQLTITTALKPKDFLLFLFSFLSSCSDHPHLQCRRVRSPTIFHLSISADFHGYNWKRCMWVTYTQLQNKRKFGVSANTFLLQDPLTQHKGNFSRKKLQGASFCHVFKG